MDTKIRELKYSDRIMLSAMIKKLTEKLEDDTLLKLVSSSGDKQSAENEDDESNYIKIAIKLFNLLVEFLEDDISKWFSNLLEVDLEEFKKNAPFDIEIVILDQLLEEKGKLRSFLAGALRLYKSMTGLSSKLSIMKG